VARSSHPASAFIGQVIHVRPIPNTTLKQAVVIRSPLTAKKAIYFLLGALILRLLSAAMVFVLLRHNRPAMSVSVPVFIRERQVKLEVAVAMSRPVILEWVIATM